MYRITLNINLFKRFRNNWTEEGSLGDLESARMGIFQITGQNSKKNYSWWGTFNTDSREKTTWISIRLT